MFIIQLDVKILDGVHWLIFVVVYFRDCTHPQNGILTQIICYMALQSHSH